MWDKYGTAVVQERVNPRNLARLAEYARLEHGPGTELGYLLAELGNGRPSRRGNGSRFSDALRGVANAVRSLAANGHVRPSRARSRVSE